MTAWSPLGAGRLTGKYLSGDGAGGRLATLGRPSDARTDAIVDEVVAVAKDVGASPAQVALAWLLSRPGAIVPIVGATKEGQLRDNLAAAERRLPADAIERLDRASAIELGFPHDFLRQEPMPKALVYGDRWREVDDRRFTVRRAPADDVAVLERS